VIHGVTIVIADQFLFMERYADPAFRFLLVTVENVDPAGALERIVETVRIAALAHPDFNHAAEPPFHRRSNRVPFAKLGLVQRTTEEPFDLVWKAAQALSAIPLPQHFSGIVHRTMPFLTYNVKGVVETCEAPPMR